VEDGQPLAWGVARRARQYPIDFGKFSTYVESVEQPAIEEPSRRLLSAIRYTGIIELEFKRDPRDGVLKLLDVNGRFWAWHTLGRRAGVDFPYLQWQAIHGEPVGETRVRAGVRWMRALTDVPAAVDSMRAGALSPREYLASFRPPVEFAIFAFDDPLPALADVPLMVRRAWIRRRATGGDQMTGGLRAVERGRHVRRPER
jgi:D-aspartate ligase